MIMALTHVLPLTIMPLAAITGSPQRSHRRQQLRSRHHRLSEQPRRYSTLAMVALLHGVVAPLYGISGHLCFHYFWHHTDRLLLWGQALHLCVGKSCPGSCASAGHASQRPPQGAGHTRLHYALCPCVIASHAPLHPLHPLSPLQSYDLFEPQVPNAPCYCQLAVDPWWVPFHL